MPSRRHDATAVAQPPVAPAGPARLGDPQAVGRRIAAASDERRRRVERVLHDGVQQHLALLGLKLSMLQKQIRPSPDKAEELCLELRQEIQNALAELRNVALLVYPALLDNEGLAAALTRSAARYPTPPVIEVQETVPIAADLVPPIYFCIIESIELLAPFALERLSVQVLADETSVRITVTTPHSDAPADVLERGLGHVTDRMVALGGTVRLDTNGDGACLAGLVPLTRSRT